MRKQFLYCIILAAIMLSGCTATDEPVQTVTCVVSEETEAATDAQTVTQAQTQAAAPAIAETTILPEDPVVSEDMNPNTDGAVIEPVLEMPENNHSAGLELMNTDLISEIGMSAEEIIAKYNLTDMTPPLDYLNIDYGHYTFGLGEYADYGVVSIESGPFTVLFPEETLGVSADEIADKYDLLIVSKYYSEMDGEGVEMVAGDYIIRLNTLENGLATEYTGTDIVNREFYADYKFGITPADFENSVVKYFAGQGLLVAPGTDVADFLSDPVTLKISAYIKDHYQDTEWAIKQNGETVTQGEIVSGTTLEFTAYDRTTVWTVDVWS